MVRVFKNSIIFLCIHPSVSPLSIHLSVTLSPKPLGVIQPNLLHHFPSWLGCVRATLFFCVSALASVVHPSVCYAISSYTTGWNSTKLANITFPHGKGVQEQHFFSMHPSSFHLLSCYLLLNHWEKFNQTYYITSPHGKGVREQHYFSMHLLSVHLSGMLSPPKPLGEITSPHGKGVRDFSICPSGVCPSVRHSISF